MVNFCVEARIIRKIKVAWLQKFSVDEGEICFIDCLQIRESRKGPVLLQENKEIPSI